MRGRRPTPTALKVLLGNPGHRKIDERGEPRPDIELGEPPPYLDSEAKRFWMSEGPKLVKLGTLGASDASLFAQLCAAHSLNVWLGEKIDELRQQKRLSPQDERRLDKYENRRIKNAALFQKLGAEFGMGAASRTRIRVTPNDGQGEFELGDSATPSAFDSALKLARSHA